MRKFNYSRHYDIEYEKAIDDGATICFEGYVESRERLEVAMWHAHKDYVEREMGE